VPIFIPNGTPIANKTSNVSVRVLTARITAPGANELRKAGYARLYEPFQDKVDALRKAQKQAMAVYDDMMVAALGRFAVATKLADPGTGVNQTIADDSIDDRDLSCAH
jgi:hypothetical protein